MAGEPATLTGFVAPWMTTTPSVGKQGCQRHVALPDRFEGRYRVVRHVVNAFADFHLDDTLRCTNEDRRNRGGDPA